MARAATLSALKYLRSSPRLAVLLIVMPLSLLLVLDYSLNDSTNHLLLFDSHSSTPSLDPRTVAFVNGDELTIARGYVGQGSFWSDDTRRHRGLSLDGPQPLASARGPRSPQRYGVCVPWLVVADSQILIRPEPTSRRFATADERAWIRKAHVEAIRNWQYRPEWMADRLLDAAETNGRKLTSIRPLWLVADVFVIAILCSGVVAAVCVGQWWWRREWLQQDGQGAVRRHLIRLCVIIAVLAIDVVAVTLAIRAHSPPFCTPTTTLFGTIHRSHPWPDVQIVFDGKLARLVFGTPRSEWSASWERVTGKIYLPRSMNQGLITPYRTIWRHYLWFRLPDERGGEAAERALRQELVNTLRINPEIGPRVPSWYWDKLAESDGETVTYSHWLILHDMLFLGGVAAIGWSLLTLAVAGAKWLRGPGPGFCSKCRYDLSCLKADRCPECGTVFREANQESET